MHGVLNIVGQRLRVKRSGQIIPWVKRERVRSPGIKFKAQLKYLHWRRQQYQFGGREANHHWRHSLDLVLLDKTNENLKNRNIIMRLHTGIGMIWMEIHYVFWDQRETFFELIQGIKMRFFGGILLFPKHCYSSWTIKNMNPSLILK